MATKPLLVGVTGGIGSGKSTICRVFETLGHLVYYADDRAKWLMNHSPELKEKIRELFGAKSYVDGYLNRQWIADQAFKNSQLLTKLNELVHPAVGEDLAQWVSANSNEQLLFDEAALLFEIGSYKKMDANILVAAPEEVRIKRVLNRDPHRTRESILDIISRQMQDEDKIPLADFVIVNDGRESVLHQTMQVYHALLSRRK